MKKLRKSFQELKKAKILYLLMLPSILYFCVLSYYPIVNGTIISFQNFRFFGKSPFVGWKNYADAISTPGFWNWQRISAL